MSDAAGLMPVTTVMREWDISNEECCFEKELNSLGEMERILK